MAKETRLSWVQRLIEQAEGKGGSVGNPDDPAKDKYPCLWEWLITVYVGKDKIKAPPSITIGAIPEGFLVRVNDRDLARAVEVIVRELDQALPALEAQLANNAACVKTYGRKEPKLRNRRKD